METFEKNHKLPTIYVVGGLLYGDEGKGTTVEYISKETKSKLVVRYNGGPQAAHHIVTPDGDFHCFSHFGSATFLPDVHNLISKYMVIYPQTMLREAKKLIEKHNITDLWKRMHIDSECFVITPYHQLINRILEILRGSKKHGSTGLGVGVCTDEAFFSHPEFFPLGKTFYKLDKKIKNKTTTLQIKDLSDKKILINKLKAIISEKLVHARNLIKNFDTNSHFIGEYLEIYKNDIINTKEGDKLKEDTVNKFAQQEKSRIIQEALLYINNTSEEHTLTNLHNYYKIFYDDYGHTLIDGNQFIKEEIEKGNDIVFEGAQGALLDRVYGIFPHLTKSLCSDANAMAIIDDVREKLTFIESENRNFKTKKIGILRAYSSRHGSGPFITNNTSWNDYLKEEHNMHSKWQGDFKVGPFDLVAAKYGIEIFKPDLISFTCVDKFANAGELNKDFKNYPICINYMLNTSDDSYIQNELKKVFNKKDFITYEEIKINITKIENENNQENNTIKFLKIKEIKKRKIEDAYCNFDLLKILKDAKPELKNLDEFKEENELENKNIFYEKMNENKEMLLKKINLETSIEDISKYLSIIESKLNVKIGILSFGPTHRDKICVLDKNEIF
jgi:adenylosuccinate synthase